MGAPKAIEDVEAKSPEEFVDYLYARNGLWASRPADWIFRGQGDLRWPISPSVFRPDTVLYDTVTSRVKRGRAKTVLTQIDGERRLLRMFLLRADSAGLPLAKHDETLFDRDTYVDQWVPLWNRIKGGEFEQWPPTEIRPNLALAQHYGVPTRLLDFSTSATTAAHFAAKTAAIHHAGDKPDVDWKAFCVWALRTEFLDLVAELRTNYASTVRVPRAHNANLHAQSGLFVLYFPHHAVPKAADPFDPRPFDEITQAVFDNLHATNSSEVEACAPAMRRIIAPARFAGAVLRLLAELGVSAASIFPGYAGSAESVLDQRFWDR